MAHILYTQKDIEELAARGAIVEVVHSHIGKAKELRTRVGIICQDRIQPNNRGSFNFTLKIIPETTPEDDKPEYRAIGADTVRSLRVRDEVRLI